MKTTLFYGPWQCRREFMSQCQRQCASEGYALNGCMWLADLKFDWQGSLVLLPVPVEAGSRYGLYHCCCNYPELSPTENATRRKEWEKFREPFREKWSEKFGKCPEENEVSWPGHHIRDLKHGGNPVDPNNLFPAKPSVHDIYNKAYPLVTAASRRGIQWDPTGPTRTRDDDHAHEQPARRGLPRALPPSPGDTRGD